MPARRFRALRICKWLATGATALILIIWPVSRYWAVTYALESKLVGTIGIFNGAVFTHSSNPNLQFEEEERGLFLLRYPLERRKGMSWWPGGGKTPVGWLVRIPLWMLLVPHAGIAALLFWKDRRLPPGHCPHCRYNLTGNVSGVCPECGTRITAKN